MKYLPLCPSFLFLPTATVLLYYTYVKKKILEIMEKILYQPQHFLLFFFCICFLFSTGVMLRAGVIWTFLM